MTMMEGVPDAPNAKIDAENDMLNNENKPINDNTTTDSTTSFVPSPAKENNDIGIGDKKNDSTKCTAIDSVEADEDLEEGEIDDEDEEETKTEPVTVDLTKSGKISEESAETSENSDANKHRGTDEGSDHSEGRGDCEKSEKIAAAGDGERKRKGRRDKTRSKQELQKELEDDEAKKRAIKEKIRALEMQMLDEEMEDEEDLEEMGILGVGGSPTRLGDGRQNRRKRKSESDPNNEVQRVDTTRDNRSRSRSPKRRKRDDGRNRKRGRDAEEGSKRAGFGGGAGGFGTGFGRNGNPRGGEKSGELCKSFMQGKCPKSVQNCLYSHDAVPPKIMELCKFYLLERCAKREKCLYLHKGFPCKYFHTGTRCMDDAESCKFSHENLTDVTRGILLKVSEYSGVHPT